MNQTFEKVFDYVNNLTIIDTHEHLCEENQISSSPDLLSMYLYHYFRVDVLSAGLGEQRLQQVLDTRIPVLDRWKIIEPYWEAARMTGYGQSLDIAVRKLYGAERIDGNTIEDLSKQFALANQPGHYKQVLKEHCKIEVSINDMAFAVNPLFRFVDRFDYIMNMQDPQDLIQFGQEQGIMIHSLQDFDNACEAYLDKKIQAGIIGLKCGIAYNRSLSFSKVSKSAAEEAFIQIFDRKNCSDTNRRILQDHILHHFLALAERREMVIQFHTGLLEGNQHILENSNPLRLNNLFIEYPNVKFDLFHMGYPFHHVIASLAKMFPNVYIDMAWAHIVSPPAAVEMLSEWIETIPENKIMGFGGDYCFVDGVYGHQYLARKNISKALAQKIEDGLMDLPRAKRIAKAYLYDNPKALFS